MAGHRFEYHYAFLLLRFDYLARQHVRQALYVKLHVSNDAILSGNVSRETVINAIDYQPHSNELIVHGIHPSPVPAEIQQVIKLRKGLSTSERTYYGSNLSRMRARYDLFGYLQ